jgi:hypothetical protein
MENLIAPVMGGSDNSLSGRRRRKRFFAMPALRDIL